MPHNHNKIMILAGEASGDELAAQLITDFLAIHPDTQFYGMGGPKMAQAGAEIIINFSVINVIGFVAVIKKLRPILAIFKQLKQLLQTQRPDLVICIDSPGFNLKIAKAAKKQRLKVLYYVSPQIWAWRYSRIKKIKRTVDHMLVLFPFEKKIYDRENIPNSYIEHPLVQKTAPYLNQINNTEQPTIALLPGSRPGEVKYHLPILLAASKIIRQQHPNTKFILPLAHSINSAEISTFIPDDIDIIEHHHYNALQNTTLAITSSGTMTLELGLLLVPHIIIYKSEPLNYLIIKYLIGIKQIGLSNIVAETTISPELIQNQATAEKIAATALAFLRDKEFYVKRKQALQAVRKRFQSPHLSQSTSKIIETLLTT